MALAKVVIFWIAIIADTITFWRLDRRAGGPFAPCTARATYATILKASPWRLNKT